MKPATFKFRIPVATAAVLASAAMFTAPMAHAAWEPTKPVEFVVPAGTGGGADQMARMIQSIVAKHNLMKQSLVVVNKGGGAGAEGFLEVQGAKGDPHKIIITLSNLFTTISDWFISLCLTMMPWIRRAIWSAPPPVPAGTTNSTGLVGSQAA